MARPEDLPDFEQPPITEVAVSVQFEPLAGFTFSEIGPLREVFRDRFPNVEYQPPIPPNFETFGTAGQGGMTTFQLQFVPSAGIPRVWLLDEQGVQLLQFQPDRLVHNWRKIGQGEEYPRYERIRDTLFRELDDLAKFVAQHQLGELVPNQCELTYVNQFPAPNGFGAVASEVLTVWSKPESACLGEPEDVVINARFPIMEGDTQVGRLFSQFGPAFDRTGSPVVQLMLIARGPPTTPTFGGVGSFLDIARDRIVRGFAALTTERMHREWQRRA